MGYKILVINPGSTSTKVAFFEEKTCLFVESLNHSANDLADFDEIPDQLGFRTQIVLDMIKKHNLNLKELNAIVGRGGLLPFVHAGGYLVNETMKRRIIDGPISEHASNLGAIIAEAIASPLNIPAYIYDCVGSDEFKDIARVTGVPDIKRESLCHVLNQKAIGRKVAEKYKKKYSDLNLIVAHLGGGFSVGAHEKGRIVDCIRDDAGAFSPERSGSVPLLYVIDMCYSGKYTKREMTRKIRGMGGLQALLNTKDCREVEKMIADGNQYAELVYHAMAYQAAKSIGEMSTVLEGNIDFIILTGGAAYSKLLTGLIAKRVKFMAPVEIVPGEDEMESLALGTLRILKGEETAAEYIEPQNK